MSYAPRIILELRNILKKYNTSSGVNVRAYTIICLIIKITIFSLAIGFKKSYFPLIHLPSCYRTVCYWIEILLKLIVKVPVVGNTADTYYRHLNN